jgi:hypothetical protein
VWWAAKGAYVPSKSRLRAFGVDRLEVGVKGSYADDADEKLVPAEGHDMDWLHMLKLSSMSNRKSDSNCMVKIIDGSSCL